MSIEAMKQALEALDSDDPSIQLRAAVALRQAIEQAEKKEPVAWIVDGKIKVRLDMAGKLYYSESNVYGKDVVDEAIKQEREVCAAVADIALLGCERSIRDRVVRAIRARGEK
jgi:hypothetical protein